MVQEGQLLWTPSKDFSENSELATYMRWLAAEKGKSFQGYRELHQWSVDHMDEFWASVWDYFDIQSDTPYAQVVDSYVMPGAKWFTGARLNYAEHILRGIRLGDPDRTAIVSQSEVRPMGEMSWRDMNARVRRLATSLRALGLKSGDRVVSYMPNVPETVIAMLATTAIGGIWSSAAPEFGTSAVTDRFTQIEPKLLFAADGYRFNGRDFDRTAAVADICNALPSLEHLVWLPYLNTQAAAPTVTPQVHAFEAMWSGAEIAEAHFTFERVDSDHPLWILFSSGTTGLPKAIVHGHGGMLLTHIKSSAFSFNMSAKSRHFFYTTTGWMMWNALVYVMLSGASIITYDGSPTHPAPDFLWKMCADAKATSFGASPTFVQGMQKLGIRPGELYDLSNIDSILLAGSPAQPETFAWFYECVKKDLWLTSQSGGTELCGGIVGAAAILPVHAGEIQCPVLGIDAHAFNAEGKPVIDEIGELVITKPAPNMPIYFWNDAGGKRYHESYFAYYPGVWRHGDFIKIKANMGSIIYGRSDSTLNRHGVRIGTSEIYRAVEHMPEIADSLVICLEKQPGVHYMPLFVKLRPGFELDDALIAKINTTLRTTCSPRHVPDEIHAMHGIPYTLSGKKMEVPVRRIFEGADPAVVASRDSMIDPSALDDFILMARKG